MKIPANNNQSSMLFTNLFQFFLIQRANIFIFKYQTQLCLCNQKLNIYIFRWDEFVLKCFSIKNRKVHTMLDGMIALTHWPIGDLNKI